MQSFIDSKLRGAAWIHSLPGVKHISVGSAAFEIHLHWGASPDRNGVLQGEPSNRIKRQSMTCSSPSKRSDSLKRQPHHFQPPARLSRSRLKLLLANGRHPRHTASLHSRATRVVYSSRCTPLLGHYAQLAIAALDSQFVRPHPFCFLGGVCMELGVPLIKSPRHATNFPAKGLATISQPHSVFRAHKSLQTFT